MTKLDCATLAALLMSETHWLQSNPEFREAYFQRTGDRYSVVAPHIAARDAMALARISATVTRWAVKACNGIERYQGNGIWTGTWFEKDELAKERAETKALAKAQAIADRYGATVKVGGDPRGCVMRLHLDSKRSNGFASDGWGL